MSSTGDDHFTRAENEADDLWVVEAVDQSGELLGFVFHLVKRQVEGEVVEVELSRYTCLGLARELVDAVVVLGVVKIVGGDDDL